MNSPGLHLAGGQRLPRWPSAGALLDLGEENYRLLQRLIPDLPLLSGNHSGVGNKNIPLNLQILEQTAYSSLLLLTWRFSNRASPAAELRAYHDARQLEILQLEGVAMVRNLGLATLTQRWQEALFLSKWLGYCLAQGYGFSVMAHDRPLVITAGIEG